MWQKVLFCIGQRVNPFLLFIFLSAMVLLSMEQSGCTRVSVEDRKFSKMVDEFFEYYLRVNPTWATGIGAHQYDGLLDDLGQDAIEARTQNLRSYLERMQEIDTTGLSLANKIDYQILGNNIRRELFELEELRGWQRNPLLYNYIIGGSIYSLICRNFAPCDERLANVISRLRQIPRLLKQAKANLDNPPRIYTETAIKQNRGTIKLIREDLAKLADSVPRLKKELEVEIQKVVTALEGYQKFLENELLPRSKGNFRLGNELYRKKLRYTLQSDLTPEEIVERAEKEYVRVREEMYQLALPIHQQVYYDHKHKEKGEALKNIVIREVLNLIAGEHPQKDELLDVCRKILNDLEKFVKNKEIIDLSGINPLVVEWQPEFSRGVTVAGLDAPGPLDRKQQSFYRVSPIPEDWTADQIESFLREYNYYMLQDLSIHEAIPGHYVQLYYANRFPSLVRTIFGSGTFIEGWAVYAERMMLEEGYGNFDPKLKLMQLKMYLRSIINAIIDVKIHTQNMSKREAMRLMIEGGFQEESEARDKWIRACLTSAQLTTYFVGVQEVLDLKKEYKKLKGDKFNLKEFHEKLLSYGSPPIKYLRQILLKID